MASVGPVTLELQLEKVECRGLKVYTMNRAYQEQVLI